VVKRVALQPPHFRPDWQAFAALLSEKTRLVILNTPHNPSRRCGKSGFHRVMAGHC
jgi:methionine aminotransferase